MPVRDLVFALSLILLVVSVAFVATAVGSEFYLFLPVGRHGRARRHGMGFPPTSVWILLTLVVVPVVIFFLSRRYSAIMFAVLPVLALLGLPVGMMVFEWTPGIAQYVLIVLLGVLAAFVWSHEDLHED